MCKKILSLCVFLATINVQIFAQEFNTNIDKQMLIISSTKNYEAAKDLAREAATKLKREWRMDQELTPNKETGLTMSQKDCAASGWEYPCYGARGHGGGQNTYYISVEHSDWYEGLSKGYYIVVAAIDDKNSSVLKENLRLVKKFYPDAYAKNITVWFGCMH